MNYECFVQLSLIEDEYDKVNTAHGDLLTALRYVAYLREQIIRSADIVVNMSNGNVVVVHPDRVMDFMIVFDPDYYLQ